MSVGVGLLVAGVGRSGTSVATRLAVSLGLRPPPEDDCMPGNEANPSGYWESESLARLDDGLLSRWSATWWTPPPAVTPELLHALDRDTAPARDAFRAVFGDEPGWVWKDPRLAALLPFWDVVLGRHPVLVPYRAPCDVAASVSARDGLSFAQSLAVWERHTRLLLHALAGRPVLVTDYAQLLADPDGWRTTLARFCRDNGVPTSQPTQSAGELVTTPRTPTAGAMTAHQQALADLVSRLSGSHAEFPEAALPGESPDTAERLATVRLPGWTIQA